MKKLIILLRYILPIYCISDTFTEELLLKPLHNEKIYAHFHFSTKWDTDIFEETFHHVNLFPRALGEVIKRHNIQEFHLSLTNGVWRYENWGYPVNNAASGAELWAWFKTNTEDVDKNWREFASSLSGLICASLNFIDTSKSISPKYSFRPTGVINEAFVNSSFLRYSSLPREVVCTENLTPFIKLLPCESKRGLSSLLNSGYIHNTRYHSIAIHLRPVCKDSNCQVISLDLQLSVDLVYDYLILGTRNWSLRRLFGQGLFSSCPLAESSTIYVDTTSNFSTPFILLPEPKEYITSYRGGYVATYAKYKILSDPLSLSASYINKITALVNSPPPLYANQYLQGYGQEQGGIVTKIYNKHWSTLDVVVLQNIPWYVSLYFHTLEIKCNGIELKPIAIKYVPGKLRQRSYHLELVLRLPPRSTTLIGIKFEHAYLKWTEYPPDASHGFYISSAVISSLLPLARNFTGLPQDGLIIADSFNASRSGYLVQVRTEVLVITLPTPDFSMPYNVICLACTVIALAFGPLHNMTTKRLVLKKSNTETTVDTIKRKIGELIYYVRFNRNSD